MGSRRDRAHRTQRKVRGIAMLTPANIANLIAEPYNWAQWAAEHHMYDTPDTTWVHSAPVDITINLLGGDPWLYFALMHKTYGDPALNAQEN